jgi:hypothetical protein
MSWKATIQKNDWRKSALSMVPPKPVSKKDIVKEIMKEVSPAISWKNTLSIVPKNGRDGKDGKPGKPGKSIVGPQGPAGRDGKDGESIVGPAGKDGLNGATWHLVTEKPDDIGNDGDFAFNKNNFEIYFKDSNEWTSLGSVKGKDKTGYVGGLNGASAYEVAVKNGFVGTEQEWLDSLQGSGGGGGGLSRSIQTIVSNQNAASTADTDFIYFLNGVIILTMPTAVGNTNQYYIKALASTGQIAFTGGQTCEGSATINLLQNDSVTLVSDGTNWRII